MYNTRVLFYVNVIHERNEERLCQLKRRQMPAPDEAPLLSRLTYIPLNTVTEAELDPAPHILHYACCIPHPTPHTLHLDPAGRQAKPET